MTEENSLDNTDTNADVETVDETTVVNDDNTDVEVDEAANSEKEVGQDTEDVETLRAEVEQLRGKLKTVRSAADKWQGTSKTASVENLRLKTALKAGLGEDSLSLLTGETEEALQVQVNAILKLSSPNHQNYSTLAGERGNENPSMSPLEKKISEQLSQFTKGI